MKKSLIRFIAAWDLCLTLPFAVPVLVRQTLKGLAALDTLLGTQAPFPAFSPLHVFFVNLFGIMCVLWALVRLYKPERYLAWFDTIGRFAVGAVMVGYTLAGGTALTAVFSASEWLFGAIALVALISGRK